jgi:predicted aspartyl protease
MPVHFFRLYFCIVLLAIPLAHASAADCALRKLASFDADASSGQILIDAKIDGKDFSAMLDTGSPYNLMDKGLVDTLKLSMLPLREGWILDAAGQGAKHMVRAHTVLIGDLKTENTPFIVLGENGNGKSHLDLVFGTGFLEANDLELDLAHGKVNMFLPDHCPGQVVYWTHEFVPIPFRILDSGHIILPITLDGAQTYAMLDTGAGLSMLSKRMAESVFNIEFDGKPDGYATAGTGARLPLYHHVFGTLDIGGIAFHNTEFQISPDKLNRIMLNANNDPHAAMRADADESLNTPIILGMHHIAKLRLYFSFKERMLYVTPANAH